MFREKLQELLRLIEQYVKHALVQGISIKKEYQDLLHKLEGVISVLILNEIDPNKEGNTARVHSYNKKNAFILVDEKGYEIKTSKNKKVTITEGIEVVWMHKKIQNGALSRVLVWLDGVYYDGYMPTGALEGVDTDNKISNKHVLAAFLNDLEHAVFRAEKRFYHSREGLTKQHKKYYTEDQFKAQLENGKNSFDANTKEFVELVKQIKKDIESIRTKDLKVSQKLLEKINTKQAELFEKAKTDEAGVIAQVATNIYKGFDPIQSKKNAKASELIEVVPLTKDWFEKNKQIQDNGWGVWNDFLGIWRKISADWDASAPSGQFIIAEGDEGQLIIEGVTNLKKHLTLLPDDSVKKWLQKVDVLNKEMFILLDTNSSKYDMNAVYASGISVKQKFGNISIYPLQTILTHEINISDVNLAEGDTHLTKKEAGEAYNNAQEEGFNINEVQANDPNKIDDLYQSESYLEIINISYILKEIKDLND